MSLLEKIQNNTCALRQQNEWLKIYTCPVPSSDFLSFVGIAKLDVPAHSVLGLLYDLESATEWVYKTREMRILKELDADEGRIVYQLVSAPWPLSDREIISQSQGFMDPETSEIFIRITSKPDFLPENPNYVRVRQLEGAWNITPFQMRAAALFSGCILSRAGRFLHGWPILLSSIRLIILWIICVQWSKWRNIKLLSPLLLRCRLRTSFRIMRNLSLTDTGSAA